MFLLRVQEREECESIVGEGDGQGEEREREEEKKRTKKKHIDVVHRRWKTNPPPREERFKFSPLRFRAEPQRARPELDAMVARGKCLNFSLSKISR